jgi:hypothetical protein
MDNCTFWVAYCQASLAKDKFLVKAASVKRFEQNGFYYLHVLFRIIEKFGLVDLRKEFITLV